MSAPVGQVGVRTPPDGSRTLDEDWRREDDEYSSLLEDLNPRRDSGQFSSSSRGPALAPAPEPAQRRVGRRRGRSNDHRLWLGLGGVAVVAAAAIFAIVKFEFPANAGDAHTLAMPGKIGCYAKSASLAKSADLGALSKRFITMGSGQVSGVVVGAYEASCGGTSQDIISIAAHLPNDSATASLATFLQQHKNAKEVPAGPMGGTAACYLGTGSTNGVVTCAWFDNDSIGTDSSPTMNVQQLASVMRTFRPAVETVAKK